jgi:eukaryotic-like serine/threonine-protein kinase
MLGDSIRRRHPSRPPRPAPRPEPGDPAGQPAAKDRTERPPRPGAQAGFPWWGWGIAAAVVLVLSFLGGYLLATRVVFPPPQTAGAGIPVPELYGMQQATAESALAALGLEVGPVTAVASLRDETGRVVAQDPVPGQQLRAGASVGLAVSAGPPEVVVPPVAGLRAATARDLLQRAGFEVDGQQVRALGVPTGAVARSEPEAGTTVRLPARIVIQVNVGAPEPELPDSPAPGEPRAGWP